MPHTSSKSFSGIFICYRRDDSSGHAGRLFDRLSTRFGEDQVFMDIEHIEPGEKFDRVIENAVGACEILIAVIGRHWISSTDGSSRRLDNPKDFVRLEIVAALNRDVRVIPVLVQGATMPRAQDLPDDLSELAGRHAHELSDLRWPRDVDQLVVALEKVLAQREEARRQAADDEAQRQLREAEEEARRLSEAARQAEERRRNELAEQQLRAQVNRQAQLSEQPATLQAVAGRREAETATTEVDEPGLSPRSAASAKRTHQWLYLVIAAAALMVLAAGLFSYQRARQAASESPEIVPVDKLKSAPTPSEPVSESVQNANASPSIPETSPSPTPTKRPPRNGDPKRVAKELDELLHPKQK
jgi:hypothetical protein